MWETSQSDESIKKIKQVLLPSFNLIQQISTNDSFNILIVKDLWVRLLTPILNLWKHINKNNTILTGKVDLSADLQKSSVVNTDSFIEVLKLEYSFGVSLVIFYKL